MPVRLKIWPLLLTILLSAFISCRQETDYDQKKQVFHYNQPNFISSLDPAFAKSQNNIWGIEHLYNQLIDLDDSLRLKPELAESWEISENKLQYRFKLRRDVYFHADSCFPDGMGRLLVASDVVFSFSRLVDTKLNSPGSWIFKGKVDKWNPFANQGDSIFIINLSSPFSPLLYILTMQYCSVVPKEAVERYGNEFSRHPVGTGPFKLGKLLGRKGLFLSSNNNYFSDSVIIDGIRISYMEDRNMAYLEFLKKEIDFFSGLQAGFAYQLIDNQGNLREDQKHNLNFVKGDFLNTEYIGINLKALPKAHPLNNKSVRQALNYAIDKQGLIKLLRYGLGTPAHSGFIPKGMLSYEEGSDSGYKYNVQKAKVLLSEAGYLMGNGIPVLTLNTNKDYADIITFVAKQWEAIGVRSEINMIETSSLREQMSQGQLGLFRASWIADYPDEESFLNVFYGKNPSPPNYTQFKNDNYDNLYEKAIGETDEAKRKLIYQQMDKLVMEECPVVFLYYDQTSWFIQNNVKNLIPNAMNLLKLNKVYKTKYTQVH